MQSQFDAKLLKDIPTFKNPINAGGELFFQGLQEYIRGREATLAPGEVMILIHSAACPAALDHLPANPPSLTAYSFRLCHESDVSHRPEQDRNQEQLAYGRRLVVASAASSSARSSSGARIHVVQAESPRPPRTHILALRSPLVS